MTDIVLRDASIVCLSSIDWKFVWQAHQEIMSRLGAAGNHVIFVENTGGVRSVRASDAGRIGHRVLNALRQGLRGDRRPVRNVTLLAPLLIPFAGSHIARIINDRILRPRLVAKVRRLVGRGPIVLYTYLPTDNALRLIALLCDRGSVVVYHSLADYAALAEDQLSMRRTETDLLRRADLVFVQSAGLKERFDATSKHVFDLGIGVNLSVFDPTAAVAGAPDELERLPRPLIGYIGGIHQHIDFELIGRIARAFSQGTVVLVGPLLIDAAAVPHEPNIKLLGPRAHEELPRLVAAFDVGLIPYRRTTYTETVNPTKLFEYLAMGTPVVSTDLPEVVALGLPPIAVRTAPEHEAFIAAVGAAVQENANDARARRRSYALERDWSNIVGRIATLIAQKRDEINSRVAGP